MEHGFELELPADDEGFVSFECPHCGGRFKLAAAEYEECEPDSLYCPMCGLSSETGGFLTPEAEQAIQAHADNLVNEMLHNVFKGLERKSRGKQLVTFKAGPPPKKKPVPGIYEVPDMAIAELRCCGLSVKVPASDALAVVYCSYCGTEQV
jgi:transcription elongation factor Elf1